MAHLHPGLILSRLHAHSPCTEVDRSHHINVVMATPLSLTCRHQWTDPDNLYVLFVQKRPVPSSRSLASNHGTATRYTRTFKYKKHFLYNGVETLTFSVAPACYCSTEPFLPEIWPGAERRKQLVLWSCQFDVWPEVNCLTNFMFGCRYRKPSSITSLDRFLSH